MSRPRLVLRTGPTHPGARLYTAKQNDAAHMTHELKEAEIFRSHRKAVIAKARYSTLYNLQIVNYEDCDQ